MALAENRLALELLGLIMENLDAQNRAEDLARCSQVNRQWHHEATRVLWRELHVSMIEDRPRGGGDRLRRIQHTLEKLGYAQPTRQQYYANWIRHLTFRFHTLANPLRFIELSAISWLKFPKLETIKANTVEYPECADHTRIVISALEAAMTTSPLRQITVLNPLYICPTSLDMIESLPWSHCHHLRSLQFRGLASSPCLANVLEQIPTLKYLDIHKAFSEPDFDLSRFLTPIWRMDRLESLHLHVQLAYDHREIGYFDLPMLMEREERLFQMPIPSDKPPLPSLRTISLCGRPSLLKRILDALVSIPLEEAKLYPKLDGNDFDGNERPEAGLFPDHLIASLRRLSLQHAYRTHSDSNRQLTQMPQSWFNYLRELLPRLNQFSWRDHNGERVLPKLGKEGQQLLHLVPSERDYK